MTVERICIVGRPSSCRAAIYAGLTLARMGHAPLVPMLFQSMLEIVAPEALDIWPTVDLRWLDACTAVLRISGESPWADMMTGRAKVRGIPIYYSLADCLAALPNVKGGGA